MAHRIRKRTQRQGDDEESEDRVFREAFFGAEIISRMLSGARFLLYYVSDDVYAWNVPEDGTLFKRREAATLIQRKLGRGNEVIEVKKGAGGKVIGAPRRRPRSRSTKASR